MLGEFEGVGEKVLEHLLETLGIGNQAAREMGVGIDFEGEFATLRLVPERTRHHVDEAAEEDLLSLDGDCARLDLGEIEDVADEGEQVSSGAVDGAGNLDLLWSEIGVGGVRA